MRLLGRYTAYYSCEMQNPIDQYNLSDQEKECIEGSIFVSKDCSELNKKNADVIKAIELQEINKTHTQQTFILDIIFFFLIKNTQASFIMILLFPRE